MVPKFTVITGGSFGAGNYGMCGRAYDPRLLWMWPNARISVGGEQAASVLATVKRDQLARGGTGLSADEESLIRQPILENAARGSPTTRPRGSGTTGFWTRCGRAKPGTLGLSAAYNAPIPDAKFGIFRM